MVVVMCAEWKIEDFVRTSPAGPLLPEHDYANGSLKISYITRELLLGARVIEDYSRGSCLQHLVDGDGNGPSLNPAPLHHESVAELDQRINIVRVQSSGARVHNAAVSNTG